MSNLPSEKHWLAAGVALDTSLHLVVRSVDGDHLITERGPDGCSTGPHSHVDALAGLRAARVLEQAARRAVDRFVKQSRAEGVDWERIGRVLGSTAAEVYERVSILADGKTVGYGFRCDDCGEWIKDRGPAADPATAQHGHAPDCGTFADAVQAHRAAEDADR